jgi:hypothetical protein
MNKQKIYWKVVSVIDGKYYSAVAPYLVQYFKYAFVGPLKNSGPLTVFKTRSHARHFKYIMNGSIYKRLLFKCIIKQSKEIAVWKPGYRTTLEDLCQQNGLNPKK